MTGSDMAQQEMLEQTIATLARQQGYQEGRASVATLAERARELPEGTTVSDRWLGTQEAQDKLIAELAAAMLEFEPIGRDAIGQSGHRQFKYAPLVNLTDATRKALARHGIVPLQSCSNAPPLPVGTGDKARDVQRQRFKTMLCGHGARYEYTLDFTPPMPSDEDRRDSAAVNALKEWGKFTTYLRRYMYQLCLILDGEPDADDEDKPRQEEKRREPPPASQQRPPQQSKPATPPPASKPAAAPAAARPAAATPPKSKQEPPATANPRPGWLSEQESPAAAAEPAPAEEPPAAAEPAPEPRVEREPEAADPAASAPYTSAQRDELIKLFTKLGVKIKVANALIADRVDPAKSLESLTQADAAALIYVLRSDTAGTVVAEVKKKLGV